MNRRHQLIRRESAMLLQEMLQLLARRNRLPLGILRYRGVCTVRLGASFGIVEPSRAGVTVAALEGLLVSVQMLVRKRHLTVM